MCYKEDDDIEVDSNKMFRKLEENQVIVRFCTTELKKDSKLNQKM